MHNLIYLLNNRIQLSKTARNGRDSKLEGSTEIREAVDIRLQIRLVNHVTSSSSAAAVIAIQHLSVSLESKRLMSTVI